MHAKGDEVSAVGYRQRKFFKKKATKHELVIRRDLNDLRSGIKQHKGQSFQNRPC